MGHLAGKDIYKKLGRKIDGLNFRTPLNRTFYEILKELYTGEEAAVVVKMPFGVSTLEKIEKTTGIERPRLQTILDGLSEKGLVMDTFVKNRYYYAASPIIIGIFEFTMMRTDDRLNRKKVARLFHQYFNDSDALFTKNNNKISLFRTLAHEAAMDTSAQVEILDYEHATALVEQAKKFSVSLCSCRHEKLHAGEKKCDIPLETCTTLGRGTDYLVRHNLAREISRQEMKENLVRSREMGLMLVADNVQRNVSFICHCCSCCCNVLLGINKYGFTNSVVTSGFIARTDLEACKGCGKCARACPVHAIEMVTDIHVKRKRRKYAKINWQICLGCGICALQCGTKAMKLARREKRIIPPANSFERVILRALENNTLQNHLFKDPASITQDFMRAFVGAFLRLTPVKKALLSKFLRSRFLAAMK